MTETAIWEALLSRAENPIVLAVLLLLLSGGVVSKRVAAIAGPLGAAARWWNNRQVRRVSRERELWSVRTKADREHETAELEQLRLDVDWLRRELRDMRRREQVRDQQARTHTAWDNEWVPRAQAAGIPIPDPPPLYLDLAPNAVEEIN